MSYKGKSKYATVSIPRAIADDIDKITEEVGYWPSRGAFVQDACIEKIRREQQLKQLEEGTEE